MGLRPVRFSLRPRRFFQYNGMTLEQFLFAYIRTEFIYPHRLVFQSDNLYAKLMERSSMKEALKID